MMTCSACTAAMTDPLRGGMTYADCQGCTARALATSPLATRALAEDPTDLRAAIEKIWKDDYEAGRRAVWAWIERIRAFRAAKDP
jgi:hypothetical protein